MQPLNNISDRQTITFGNAENSHLWHFQNTDNQYRYNCKITPNSTGKELDTETGYSYFGARYLDHTLTTAWLSVDPMSDKYPSISPYAYCAWNPVRLIDPEGDSIDVSKIYEKNRDGSYVHKNLVAAFEFFAKTKYGQEELGKYAKSGQIIAGHTYSKDGEYHKRGIDISFGYRTSRSYYNGETKPRLNNRLKIEININAMGDAFSKITTICHEMFIHARQASRDFLDDGKMNHSYLTDHLKKYVKDNQGSNWALYYAEHAYFAWEDVAARKSVINILQQYSPKTSKNSIITKIEETLGNQIKIK